MREKTCCFTGHRQLPEGQKMEIMVKLENTIVSLIHSGYLYFGAGGALGFDTLAAQAVLRLRRSYPQIKLILVLPCTSQADRWASVDAKTYQEILEQADKVVYTSQKYTSGCMFKRNRHLVDHSSACVCYLTKRSGGTAYTVEYAKKHGLKIFNIAEFGCRNASQFETHFPKPRTKKNW